MQDRVTRRQAQVYIPGEKPEVKIRVVVSISIRQGAKGVQGSCPRKGTQCIGHVIKEPGRVFHISPRTHASGSELTTSGWGIPSPDVSNTHGQVVRCYFNQPSQRSSIPCSRARSWNVVRSFTASAS